MNPIMLCFMVVSNYLLRVQLPLKTLNIVHVAFKAHSTAASVSSALFNKGTSFSCRVKRQQNTELYVNELCKTRSHLSVASAVN